MYTLGNAPSHARTLTRRLLLAVGVVFILALAPMTANAALTLLKPNASDPATFSGNGGYSADGLGQLTPGGSLQAEVPAGSTVVQAYLYGTYFFTTDPTLAERTIDFDGTSVVLTKISDVNTFLATARADVTSQVATKVGSGGGITNFVVNNDHDLLDGLGLVVIFSNPLLPFTTIAVLDGGASQTGDTATFTFAAPLDKTTPGFSAIMSLGSGFSFQGGVPASHECGTQAPQSSLVDINGVRLTSCAGNYDDGEAQNGALITVGGVGDTIDNPADPNQQPADGGTPRVLDDELYNLEPFLAQGASGVTIATSNPSQDDNLFLAIIAITARATVTTENCTNGIDDDGDGLVDAADPDCQVQPPAGRPDGFTGGGTITDAGLKVSHGLTLPCDASLVGVPERLQVNWGKGNRFHLTDMTAAACTDDPTISEGQPVAGFDTFRGSGTGRYNGVDGATADWTLTDAGEPGDADQFSIRITDAGGTVVLERSGTLSSGNQQAHPGD